MIQATESIVSETVPRCDYGDGRRALHTLQLEGQGYFVVCTLHKKKLENQDKDVRCQYCGVPIKNDWRKTPLLERFKHVPACPRSDEEAIEIG